MKPVTLLVAIATLILPQVLASVHAAETHTVTLAYETEVLDIDTGAVISQLDSTTESSGSDLKIAYNADRTVPSVVMSSGTEGVELAFLTNTGLDTVSTATLSGLTFSSQGEDVPFTAFDTVVVKTDVGSYYKLGNVSEQSGTVTFDYQLVE